VLFKQEPVGQEAACSRTGSSGRWSSTPRPGWPRWPKQYVRLDYVDNWSLWTDVAIVAKTAPTVLLRRGAY